MQLMYFRLEFYHFDLRRVIPPIMLPANKNVAHQFVFVVCVPVTRTFEFEFNLLDSSDRPLVAYRKRREKLPALLPPLCPDLSRPVRKGRLHHFH